MSLLFRALPFVMLATLGIIVPAMILASDGPAILLLPVLAIAGWNSWFYATLAHRVLLHDDGSLEWVALGRRVRTRPEDLVSLRPYGTMLGVFTVKHAAGKLRLVNQMTGFHEIVVHIKNRNPAVHISGC